MGDTDGNLTNPLSVLYKGADSVGEAIAMGTTTVDVFVSFENCNFSAGPSSRFEFKLQTGATFLATTAANAAVAFEEMGANALELQEAALTAAATAVNGADYKLQIASVNKTGILNWTCGARATVAMIRFAHGYAAADAADILANFKGAPARRGKMRGGGYE